MRSIPSSDNKQRSGPHRRVEKILDGMGISYMSEIPFPPYTADIFLPEWRLSIEIDGPQHSRAKDRVRDEYLAIYYRVPVLRINAKLWQPTGKIEAQITEFIEKFANTTSFRKQHAPHA